MYTGVYKYIRGILVGKAEEKPHMGHLNIYDIKSNCEKLFERLWTKVICFGVVLNDKIL
jgi:hypothetical protein